MNLGLGRPRRRHDSGNSDLGRALVPSLPTAIRSPSGLCCLRRAGAGTSETGKAARELAGSRFPIGDTVPFPAKRPPTARPGSGHVVVTASRTPGPGAVPPDPPRPRLISLEAQPRPSPDFGMPFNFLLFGEPECVPLARWSTPESQAGPRVRLPLQPFVCVLGSQSEFSALGLRGSTQLLIPCDSPPPPQHTHTPGPLSCFQGSL